MNILLLENNPLSTYAKPLLGTLAIPSNKEYILK